MNNEKVQKLQTVFHAAVERSNDVRVIKKFDWTNQIINNSAKHTLEFEPCYTIKLSETNLRHLIDSIDLLHMEELDLRERIPALQKAYDHYQTLLKICMGDNNGY